MVLRLSGKFLSLSYGLGLGLGLGKEGGLRLRLTLGGDVVGSVLVATPGSVHGTFF